MAKKIPYKKQTTKANLNNRNLNNYLFRNLSVV